MRTGFFGETLDQLPGAVPASEVPARYQGWEPDMLRTLPKPPEQPRSLFQPASAPLPTPQDLERPYFQPDPLLDPPQWGWPGWFGDVQFGAVHPHVFSQMNGIVTTGLGRQVNVALGNARMNWAFAPRFEVGYRLPSGFGGFAVSERFFDSFGSDTIQGPNGPAARTSRLSTSYTDFDYFSREYTPFANWGMTWRLGMRVAYSDIRTRASEPFAEASAGNGILAAKETNTTEGIGPHTNVALDRRLGDSGFSFITKADFAYAFGRIHDRFEVATTSVNAAGHHDRGLLKTSFFQSSPILNVQFGLGWQPPSNPNLSFFLGYVNETWFKIEDNANTISTDHTGTRGYFTNQGIIFQAGLNY
jgi:hypothetical protein